LFLSELLKKKRSGLKIHHLESNSLKVKNNIYFPFEIIWNLS